MKRRSGFTITEMLVSMALILFIMVILSEAFIAGVDTFRQLKAIGDMETKLRAVVSVLRRDLEAPHFCNDTPSPMRLSNYNPVAAGNANLGGFFSILALPNSTALTIPTSGAGIPTTNANQGTKQVYLTSGQLTASNAPQPGAVVTLTQATSGPNGPGQGKPPATETLTVDWSYSPPSNPIVLSNAIKNSNYQGGKIQWVVPPVPEGGATNGIPNARDADGLVSYGTPVPNFALHFTVNLAGTPYATGVPKQQRRESFFTANLGAAAPATGPWPVTKYQYRNSQGSLLATGPGGPGAGQWLLQPTITPTLMQSLSQPLNSYALPTVPGETFTLPTGYSALPTNLNGQPMGQPPFYDSANYYSPYAEVAYFLRLSPTNQQTSAPLGLAPSPLFSLYRRQLVLLNSPSDYANMNTVPNPAVTGWPFQQPQPATTYPAVIGPLPSVQGAAPPNSVFYDFSWIPVANTTGQYYMHFNNMQDVRHHLRRSLTYGAYNPSGGTINPSGWWPPQAGSSSPNQTAVDPGIPIIGERQEPANLQGTDLLLTNVVAMTIRVRRMSGSAMDSDFGFWGYDTYYNPQFRIQAIEIMLRVWDQKTQKTRQLTIVQNM